MVPGITWSFVDTYLSIVDIFCPKEAVNKVNEQLGL